MGLVTDSTPAVFAAVSDVDHESRCFICGQLLRGPFWHWSGTTGEIALHLSCAARWQLTLAFDLRSAYKQGLARFQ